MVDLCTACLCAGRTLCNISDWNSYNVYTQIMNEIPVYNISDLCLLICWECQAILKKFVKFKETVKRSYFELQQLHQNSSLKLSLAKPPNIKIHNVFNYSSLIKADIEIKDELEPETNQLDGTTVNVEVPIEHVKDEVVDVETHCEETFVNNLYVKRRKKDGEKKVKKKDKSPLKHEKSSSKKNKLKQKVRLPSIDDHFDDEDNVELPIGNIDNSEIGNVNIEESKINNVNIEESKINNVNIEESQITNVNIEESQITNVNIERTEIANEVQECVIETKYSCNDCGEKFEDKFTLKKHIKSYHSKKKVKLNGVKTKKLIIPDDLGDKPKCPECGKQFSSKKTFRYHMTVLHQGQNRHPCPRCGKVYQWKSNLGRHMRSHKARDTGELYCSVCDKKFASIATYRQHLKISRKHVSESEFSFMCNECGKKFVNKTRLRDHIDWEHLKKIKFKCQLCSKPFKCHTSLYVHMQNVHRDKEKKDNLCHVCGKSYQNAAKLKYHIVAMHTSETPYRCVQCSAAFGWYSSLYRHVREVHYKMKLQPKKTKKSKKPLELLPPGFAQQIQLTHLPPP